MSLDLYIDYLICSTSYTTATGLSKLTDNAISHDKVTRFLSSRDFTATDLWLKAKPLYNSIKRPDGVLIVDDSVEEKPYTDENEVVAWHWDHKESHPVKGINFVSLLYESANGSVPLGFEPVRKDMTIIDKKTGKTKRKASISKHQHFRNLIKGAIANNVEFKYVLNDCWFTSAENLKFIKIECQKNAIMAIKGNRKVALSDADKALGKFVRIDSLKLEEGKIVRLEGLDFPLRLTRQVFKNEDASTGVLYLVSTDLELTDEQITTIYQRRWKVETYHQSIKSNASLAKSPAKKPRTQLNHLFASLCAYIQLESMAKPIGTNHFALKQKIYMQALKTAMHELHRMKNTILQTEIRTQAPA